MQTSVSLKYEPPSEPLHNQVMDPTRSRKRYLYRSRAVEVSHVYASQGQIRIRQPHVYDSQGQSMARTRQPRPDSVLGFQVKDLKTFKVFHAIDGRIAACRCCRKGGAGWCLMATSLADVVHPHNVGRTMALMVKSWPRCDGQFTCRCCRKGGGG